MKLHRLKSDQGAMTNPARNAPLPRGDSPSTPESQLQPSHAGERISLTSEISQEGETGAGETNRLSLPPRLLAAGSANANLAHFIVSNLNVNGIADLMRSVQTSQAPVPVFAATVTSAGERPLSPWLSSAPRLKEKARTSKDRPSQPPTPLSLEDPGDSITGFS